MTTAIAPHAEPKRHQIMAWSADDIGFQKVELSPGKRGRPLPDGAMIPAAQSSAATELDTVLKSARDMFTARPLSTAVRSRGFAFGSPPPVVPGSPATGSALTSWSRRSRQRRRATPSSRAARTCRVPHDHGSSHACG